MKTAKPRTPAAVESVGFLSCHIKSWKRNLKDIWISVCQQYSFE